ncbi:tRNA wybutosine-synthesizing protein 5 [Halyomorpha halys]|uniref:tRNA wybutosine-synthesizing protein 5 n=1 Tax=Halyomorpha halys TaxID=286706 RepID=UPI0006D511E7|nr:tRNA wybutosine-synthesizing protein 5-like [Halyomorpha halys]XP_014276965.1 tRNA wybutosine-synthesizing protein 5-like [Halyomorpha halys]
MAIKKLPVDVYNYINKDDFQAYIAVHRKPLILRNFCIGQCLHKWSTDYLVEKIGKVDVKVHVSPVGRMNFLHKNFTYKTMSFQEFLSRTSGNDRKKPDKTGLRPILCDNEVLYLRAIGTDRRGRNVANFKNDFPQIADDLTYPEIFNENKFFSSVFRIASAGVQIWTHYDVMDNILIQVSGTKRVVLFDPNDAPYMYLNGDKSEVMNIDSPDVTLYPNFPRAVQYICELQPGDSLYIPAFWFHNVLCNTFSIGVNVFWKHLENEMYDKHDVYGNKDIIPAAKALDHISKARNLLKTVPEECRLFYLHRCIADLSKDIETMTTETPKASIIKEDVSNNSSLYAETANASIIYEGIARNSNFLAETANALINFGETANSSTIYVDKPEVKDSQEETVCTSNFYVEISEGLNSKRETADDQN